MPQMPPPNSTRNGALITETVVEEPESRDSSDQPSPGTPVAPSYFGKSSSQEKTQQTPYVGLRQSDESNVDTFGSFQWQEPPAPAGTATPPSQAPGRKNHSLGASGKDPNPPGSRRPSVWTRSKSLAENYLKPDASTEQGRGQSYFKPRPEVTAVGINSANTSGVQWQPSATNSAFDSGRRRSSAGLVASNSLAPVSSRKGSRNNSLPLQPRSASASQEAGPKSLQNKPDRRREKRLSITEYVKPGVSAERARRNSSTIQTTNTRGSQSTTVSRKSEEAAVDAPVSVISSKSPFRNHSIWGSAVKSGSPAQSLFPRHFSTSEEPLGRSKTRASIAVFEKAVPKPGVYFRSRRINEKPTDRSWLQQKKDPRQRWLSMFPLIGIILGLIIAGVYIFLGVRSVPQHKYCMIYEDDFTSGTLDPDVWTKEVEVGGFGNGQFEETTATDENVFIKDSILHIQPTLQDVDLLTHNHTLNLTKLGTCTSDLWSNCVAVTNTTNGTIINPVKSGRINTKKGANLKYGRIEVVAKMPQGDWLWPAIWMLPTASEYGEWPRSGEIDIVESRGNNFTYPQGGDNVMSSALHWGPDSNNDAWWRTYRKQSALHSTFSEQFHTFGLEWSEKYLYTYLDSRLLQVLYNKFNTPFWKRGDFPLSDANGTAILDPWSQNGNAAPFDQEFYLILNVAVGGTNGWFKDGVNSKPWVDTSTLAKSEFWAAKDSWYPTWQNTHGSSLQVKSVRMWQQQGYNGCAGNARGINHMAGSSVE
ncbi:hypothetical protein LTR20_008110 [Exophiala xenobiotica]|nr:hypothetical protein LTR41_001200 [Exophiala xenobiotica]KAK5280933.1 hypothetical protein LTR40_005655 [Exophiala xenobiotica]KAK5324196.1 hypothetical protein LTR93_004983 [Exophiala xenobiotica]KAK5384062.1 hypothetical protein LTS13_002255 [Exophiala xenobiotica]KAK5399619.1 hypothetical protein LTR79_003256 [Exophiala xenobiotica]